MKKVFDTILLNEFINKYTIDKSVIKDCIRKYGQSQTTAAVLGKTDIGMTKELMKMAKGEQNKVNRTSYGKQWVWEKHGNDCVNFKEGTKHFRFLVGVFSQHCVTT